MSIEKFRGAFTIGSSMRKQINDFNENPGPGAHEQNFFNKQNHPSIKFNKYKRQQLFKSIETPGPNQYEQKSFIGDAVRYSLRKKLELKDKSNNNFGYNSNIVTKSVPKYTISHNNKRYLNEEEDNQLGPGQYYKDHLQRSIEKEQQQINLEQIRYKYNKFQNEQIEKMDTTIGSKMNSVDRQGFMSSSIVKGNRDNVFGRAQRFKQQEQCPGPSDYKPNYKYNYNQKFYSMTKGLQIQNDNNELPGPSDYTNYYNDNKKLEIMFSKSDRKNLYLIDESIPAPNQYFPKIQDTKYLIKFINSKRKTQQINQDILQTPGPQFYDNLQKQNTHKNLTFQKQQKFTKQRNIKPGPGDYNIEKDILKKNKIILTKRDDVDKTKNQIKPSPCDYEIKDQKVIKYGKIDKQQRFNKTTSLTPGPGSYNIKQDKSRCSSFGLKKKQDNKSGTDDYLGPGSYQITHDLPYLPSYLKKKNNNNSSQHP